MAVQKQPGKGSPKRPGGDGKKRQKGEYPMSASAESPWSEKDLKDYFAKETPALKAKRLAHRAGKSCSAPGCGKDGHFWFDPECPKNSGTALIVSEFDSESEGED